VCVCMCVCMRVCVQGQAEKDTSVLDVSRGSSRTQVQAEHRVYV
jgi:hypothetical protein